MQKLVTKWESHMLSVLFWLWTKAIQVQKASQSVSQSVLPWGEPVLKKAKEKAFPEKRKNAYALDGQPE